jgi:hypothetical protein
MKKLGVFSVQGPLSPRLSDTRDIKPILDYLVKCNRIRNVHKAVSTKGEFLDIVGKWRQRQYASLPVCYLSFHGTPGYIHIGRNRVSLEELSEALRGACAGRTVFISSCETLDVSRHEIDSFRRVTGAKCVAGYTESADLFESAAFELLLFEALSLYERNDAVERRMKANYRPLVKRLGFKMYYGHRRLARRTAGSS